MRQVSGRIRPGTGRRAFRIAHVAELSESWEPTLNFMIPIVDAIGAQKVESLIEKGLANVSWVESDEVEPGDVVFPVPGKGLLDISYRKSDLHHTLFLTNRCNSNCLMCSQPPTKNDDGWLVDEAVQIVRHIAESPYSIGITGGEPLLLSSKLRLILDELTLRHPSTRIDLLTNGRLLSKPETASDVLDGLTADVTWLVPLYGHAHMLHDFVVQAPGAFEQTLEGLLCLQERAYPIQLRVVLIEPVLGWLEDLCEFIGKNLPFVREVALMACEPIGFALANKDMCSVDLREWHPELLRASVELSRRGVRHVFMNTPLCALPKKLWPAAQRSISDWKQVYAIECSDCAVRDSCSGLFAWHEQGWAPTKVTKIASEIV
jgi:His-Xaa-Ser system radical SAM maturase HxsC